jgi:stage V sporulation protein AD
VGSLVFKNIYINDYYSVVGPLEKNSRLKIYDVGLKDYYFGVKTFEQAEIKMQQTVIDNLMIKNNLQESEIDLIVGGDLLNQISATGYAMKNYSFPLLGIYAACATFAESLIVSASFLNNSKIKKVLTITSSHNLTAERQFRYPVEYGAPKPHTATFTATGAIGTIMSKKESKIKVESATVGAVVDMGINDPNNMGAVMAPAAAKTLFMHLNDLKRDIDYYDVVLTGDLGCVGASIFKEYLKVTYNIKLKKYFDAGCELYLKEQDTYAGGSGPVCLPLILFNQIIPSKKYKKILIIATGSLHSTTLVNQHKTIPAIAHAVSLEVI